MNKNKTCDADTVRYMYLPVLLLSAWSVEPAAAKVSSNLRRLNGRGSTSTNTSDTVLWQSTGIGGGPSLHLPRLLCFFASNSVLYKFPHVWHLRASVGSLFWNHEHPPLPRRSNWSCLAITSSSRALPTFVRFKLPDSRHPSFSRQ